MLSEHRNSFSPNQWLASFKFLDSLNVRDKFGLIVNLLGFQAGWFVSILLGSLSAVIYTAVFLLLHSVYFASKKEWMLIAGVVMIGVVADSIFSLFGILNFTNTLFFIPGWLVCLWCLFAATICHSLSWMRNLPWLAFVFAAVAGPLSYLGGARLADVSIGQPLWLSLCIMSIWWGVLFTFVITFSRKIVDAK